MGKSLNAVNIKNKRASFDYEFIELYEAGIVLEGTEIKSIRNGKASINEAYCIIDHKGEAYIRNMHIAEYEKASFKNHEPRRDRKLLLNKTEIGKIKKGLEQKGFALVPTKVFCNPKGYAKVAIALAKGKKLFDKRESIKEKDIKRDLARGL